MSALGYGPGSANMATPTSITPPQAETVAEIMNTLANLANSVAQSSVALSNAIAGELPTPTESQGQPARMTLPEQLRLLRQALNFADAELARARQALGV